MEESNDLSSPKDSYGCVVIKSESLAAFSTGNKEEIVQNELSKLRENNVRGVWVHIQIDHSDWITAFAKEGFEFHHAKGQKVVMTKWLENSSHSLPNYPFTNVGVGGLVIGDDGRILLMRERRGPYLGWKFPGGVADEGEDILRTAEREVFEETGVECVAESILAFRHLHKFRFPQCSDFYFVCLLRPKDPNKTEPKPCPDEAADSQWFTREELESEAKKEISPMSRYILSIADAYQSNPGLSIEPKTVSSFGRQYLVYATRQGHSSLESATAGAEKTSSTI